MKKIFLSVILILLLFVGCTSIEVPFTPNVKVSSIEGEDVANVSLVSLYGSTIFGETGTKGYGLFVENKSDAIIKVDWSKSSIFYNNNSSLPFITGQKYIDKNEPMSPSIVPKNGKFDISVYSSDQVYYSIGKYGGWELRLIPTYESTVIICIEHSSGETYYTFDVTPQAVPEA